MKLFFLRHGDASTCGDFNGENADPSLTRKGEMQIRELAFLMTGQNIKADRLFTSPAKRTQETAKIIKKECGWTIPVEMCPALALPGHPGDLIDFLNTLKKDGQFFFVGHAPIIGDIIRVLVGAKMDNSVIAVPKGCLFYMETDTPVIPGAGTLRWQLPSTAGPAIA